MKHNQIRQVVFPILAALIWGTAFVAQDVCADTIGTFTFNAVRYFIAVLALLVLIAVLNATRRTARSPRRRKKRTGRKQLWLGGFLLRHGAGHRLELPAGRHRRRDGCRKGGLSHGAVRGARAGVRPIFETQGQPAGVGRGRAVGRVSVPAVHQGQLPARRGRPARARVRGVLCRAHSGHRPLRQRVRRGEAQLRAVSVRGAVVGRLHPVFRACGCRRSALVRAAAAVCGRILVRCGLHAADPRAEGLQPHGRHHPAESRERVRRHRGRDHPAPEHDPARIPRLRADVPRRRPSRRSRCRPRPPARKMSSIPAGRRDVSHTRLCANALAFFAQIGL